LLLLQVDAAGFEKAMEEAREKSRAAGKKTGVSNLQFFSCGWLHSYSCGKSRLLLLCRLCSQGLL
jgi:hypothetical protein